VAAAAENRLNASAQLRTSVATSSATPKVKSVINAQIAAGYALTLRLPHQWYLVTSTSVLRFMRRIDDSSECDFLDKFKLEATPAQTRGKATV
jgi:hypothetical protein